MQKKGTKHIEISIHPSHKSGKIVHETGFFVEILEQNVIIFGRFVGAPPNMQVHVSCLGIPRSKSKPRLVVPGAEESWSKKSYVVCCEKTTSHGAQTLQTNGISTTVPSTGEFTGFLFHQTSSTLLEIFLVDLMVIGKIIVDKWLFDIVFVRRNGGLDVCLTSGIHFKFFPWHLFPAFLVWCFRKS